MLILRNPVDRLWSAYTFQRELGNVTGFSSFEDYLAACRTRRRDGTDLVPGDHLHGLYIGYYADYVPLWLDAFGDDIRVLFTEQLTRDPVGVMGGLFDWLGIDAERGDHDGPRRAQPHEPSAQRPGRPAGLLREARDRAPRPDPRQDPGTTASALPAGQLRPGAGGDDPRARREIEELYRESNEQTAAALRAHGYAELPPWLDERAVAD